MPRKTKPNSAIKLPRGVHRVVARGREYFTYQRGRGTTHAGPRIKLPNDPHSPEFWTALRQAQGIVGPVATDTVDALVDAFIAAWPTLPRPLSKGTQGLYTRGLSLAKKLWGSLKARGLKPAHVNAQMKAMVGTKGAANNFLTAMNVLSTWGRANDHLDWSITEGVKPYKLEGGHQPWTAEQIAAAHEHLTGGLRRGVLLMLYTGQRSSDMVRLGPTMVDDGGFDLGWRGQAKTGTRPWMPIWDELKAEMASWEKRPGPYVLSETGKPFTSKYFNDRFQKAIEEIPELEGCSVHGLRATAVIRLKREGFAEGMISNMVGMSLAMVMRYTRFENKRESGKAALVLLAERKNALGNAELYNTGQLYTAPVESIGEIAMWPKYPTSADI